MTSKKNYDAPEVRVMKLAGMEAILNASAKGDLPWVEELEDDFIF